MKIEENILIQITKREKDYLVSKGFQFGHDLHRTYSKHKKYYATEEPKLMKILNNYRKSVIVK